MKLLRWVLAYTPNRYLVVAAILGCSVGFIASPRYGKKVENIVADRVFRPEFRPVFIRGPMFFREALKIRLRTDAAGARMSHRAPILFLMKE